MSIGIQTDSGQLNMSFKGGDDLFTNVALSLGIEQGSFFANPSFGFLTRPRLKNTAASASLIEGDIRQALQWLLDTGRATAIDIVMQIDTGENRNRLKARVTVTGAKGNQITYDKFVEVV